MKFENPTRLTLRLPFSKKSPLEQLLEFKKRRAQIKESTAQFKLMKLNGVSKKMAPITKLEGISKEINMINAKCINKTNSKSAENYLKTSEVAKTLKLGEKRSAVIEIMGELNHKFKNAIQTKLDTVWDKLDLV